MESFLVEDMTPSMLAEKALRKAVDDLSTEQAILLEPSTEKQVEEFLFDVIDVVVSDLHAKNIVILSERDQFSIEQLLSNIKTANLFGASRISSSMGNQNLRFGAYPNSKTDFAFNYLAGESSSSMINDFDYLMHGDGFGPRPLPLPRKSFFEPVNFPAFPEADASGLRKL